MNSSTSLVSTESPSVSSRIGKGKNQDHNRGIAVAPSGVTVAGLLGLYPLHPIAQRLSDSPGGTELPNSWGPRTTRELLNLGNWYPRKV